MSNTPTLAAARNQPVGGSAVGVYAWSILAGICVPFLVGVVTLIAVLINRQTLPPGSVTIGRTLVIPVGDLGTRWDPIWQLLSLVAIGLFVAALFSLAVWRCQLAADGRARKITRHLQEQLLDQSRRRAEAEGAATQRNRAMELIHGDLPALQEGLSAWYRLIPRAVVTIVGCAALALAIDVWVTFVSASIGYGLGHWFVKLRKARGDAVTQWEVPRLRDRLAELIGDAPRMTRLRAPDAGRRLFEQETTMLYRRLERRDRQLSRTWPLVFLSVAAAAGLVLSCIGAKSLDAGDPIRLPGAIALLAAIAAAAAAVVRLTRGLRQLPVADEAMRNVLDYLRPMNDASPTEQRVGLPGVRHSVDFDQVTLVDNAGKPIVDNLTLTLTPGTLTCLLGTSPGSTRAVVDLIMGFGRPVRGRVAIDGIPLGEVHPQSLATNVMWIEPRGPIWDGTVMENVRGGDDGVSPTAVSEVLQRLEVYERLHRLPEGLSTHLDASETVLDEEATYAIGVARASLGRPPILIAAEPPGTGATDDPAMTMLREMADAGAMVVVMPRRLATLRSADRVVLFNGPRLAGEGDHATLLADSDLYRHLNYQLFNPYRRA